MRHLTYANIMSTIGVFLALGGSAYAVSTQNPVKIARASLFASATRVDAEGNATFTGSGLATATCPRGYIALGGGPMTLLSDAGTVFATTSAPSTTNNRNWVVGVTNYNTTSQIVPVYVTCAKATAM